MVNNSNRFHIIFNSSTLKHEDEARICKSFCVGFGDGFTFELSPPMKTKECNYKSTCNAIFEHVLSKKQISDFGELGKGNIRLKTR